MLSLIETAAPNSSSAAKTQSIEVVPLTATIGAELRHVSLAEAARDDTLFAEIKELLLQYKVLFVRDQDITPRASTSLSPSGSGRWRTTRSLGSDPDHPGLVRIYKDLDSTPEHYENAFHCDATWRESPPMGSVLRCVETPAGRRRHDLGEHGRGLPAAARARADPDRAACAPGTASRRASARRCPPSSAAPCTRGSPTPNTRSCAPTPRPARRSCSSTRSPPISSTSTRPENVRFGLDYAPGASELLNYLVRQASVPEYQVRWRWTPNSFAIWDNRSTQHYAVQDYWPAVRKMERAGIVGTPTF